MPLLRTGFAYPAGLKAGFDPSHIAVQGQVTGRIFSAVAHNRNMVSLLRGLPGALGATAITFGMDGIAGPTAVFTDNSTTCTTGFSGHTTGTDAVCTMAYIGVFPSAPAATAVFNSSNASNRMAMGIVGGFYNVYVGTAFADVSSGIPVLTGAPFFLCCSLRTGASSFVLVNLATGKVTTATSAVAFTNNTTDGIFQVGANSQVNSTNLNLSAVMYSPKSLNMSQLLKWAADPWSFWYPCRASSVVAVTAVSALVVGWQHGADDSNPRPPIRFHPAAALALTPTTLPPVISGMAWFVPTDRDRPAVKVSVESLPAIALTPSTLPPIIAGMAWFEPPDPKQQPPLQRPHPAPAATIMPSGLLSQLIGVPWFEQLDVYQPCRWFVNDPAFVTPPAAAPSVGISGMAWFEPPDRNLPSVKVNVESLPAIALTPATLPPVISGMAWFVPTDRAYPSVKINVEASPAIALTPATLPPQISGMAWRQPLDDLPLRPRIDRPHPGPALTITPQGLLSSLIGVPWAHAPDDKPNSRPIYDNSAPAAVLTPDTLPPRIAGIAWFVPTDRSYPSVKVRIEAPAALVLTPATLPPQISGMSWFAPLDIYQPHRYYLQDAPAFGRPVAGVAISGMAWFEPPDRDRPAVKISVESPAAIALTPATLPPQISGMAWRQPLDVYLPRRWFKNDPAAFGRSIPEVAILGAWFTRPDIAPRKKPPVPMDWPTAWVPYVVTVTSSFVRRPLLQWPSPASRANSTRPVWSYWKGRSS